MEKPDWVGPTVFERSLCSSAASKIAWIKRDTATFYQ